MAKKDSPSTRTPSSAGQFASVTWDASQWQSYPPGPSVPIVLPLTCAEAQSKALSYRKHMAHLKTLEDELKNKHLIAEQHIVQLKQQHGAGKVKQRDATARMHTLDQYCQIIQGIRGEITKTIDTYRDADLRLGRYCLALQDLRSFVDFVEPPEMPPLDQFEAPPPPEAISPVSALRAAHPSPERPRLNQAVRSAGGSP